MFENAARAACYESGPGISKREETIGRTQERERRAQAFGRHRMSIARTTIRAHAHKVNRQSMTIAILSRTRKTRARPD